MQKRLMILPFIIICSIFLLGAKDNADSFTVNGVKASKGDIITYEYYMSGVKDPVEAAGAYLIYTNDSLEYIDGSIGFDVLKNAMTNSLDDSIYYCAIDVTNGFNFENEGLVVKASFKVTDTSLGDAYINNAFDEIFTFENEDTDLTLNDYKFREVIKVNDMEIDPAIVSGIDAQEVIDTQLSGNEQENNNMVFIVIPIAILIVIFSSVLIIKKEKT